MLIRCRLLFHDRTHSNCKCDGKQKSSDLTFSSYEECCEYAWINKFICMKHIHDCTPQTIPLSTTNLDLWYPDENSRRCRRDGNNPDGVLLFTSYQVCCFRSMPSATEQCENNSKAL